MSASARGKGWRARPLADFILRQINPLVAKQGFGEASLFLRWREIVGPRIAGQCEPIRLQWPPRPRGAAGQNEKARETPPASATLKLRVEPGFGLEIQHLAPAIIERVNGHLGWRCVDRVILRQEPLSATKPGPAPRPALPQDPEARARAAAVTEGIVEDGLRAALTRLGESALTTKRRARG